MGRAPSPLARNPAAILGTIAHQLLTEAAQKRSSELFDAAARWKSLVEAANEELKESWLDSALFPIERTAAMYDVIRIRTCARADEIGSARIDGRGAAQKKTGIGFELWVESRDKSIGGWIDAVRRIKDEVVLSDFKSGEVLEKPRGIAPGEVKESHSIQLKLYAALYFDTYGTWPSKLQVVPLKGATIEIPFTEDESRQLLSDATSTLIELNGVISSGSPRVYRQLAFPSPEHCRYCSYRPTCPHYREIASRSDHSGGWPADAFGRVWDINVLRNGSINLRVSGKEGRQYVFRGLSSTQRHPALNVIQRGDSVGIFNARASSNRAEFSEGPTTVLYKLELSEKG